MIEQLLIWMIGVPLLSGIVLLCLPRSLQAFKSFVSVLVTALTMGAAAYLYGKEAQMTLPWTGFGIEFSLRLYHFSALILACVSVFAFLIAVYCSVFMRGKKSAGLFISYVLITLAMVNGAVLSNNLVLFLFFWESLLILLFTMIAVEKKSAFSAAVKAFVLVGISDVCMMIGIAIAGYLAGTFDMSQMHLPLDVMGSVAFMLLVIGAIAKAGSMPFHSWIPDAAVEAPLPFMAFLPAAIEKLLGIYFLVRVCKDLFQFTPDSGVSVVLMAIGACTILFAVMMALIQKDFKRLLSYHAISQVGYMILGIGTALPIGIVGGLFHMLNNALYKSCLFLSGGAVEHQTGTTNLEKLGGLGRKMPLTFLCFTVAAVSISGVPPFNGFFSKELVYDAALERGVIFYLAAVIGSFFTAASFLKLGHAAFLGPLNAAYAKVKEVSWRMAVPMLILAGLCVVFGLWNALPINSFFAPVLGAEQSGTHHSMAGFPANTKLVVITIVVLISALINHIFGVQSRGSGLKAVDHIHYAPVLKNIYERAERRFFDPFDIGLKFIGWFSRLLWMFDRGVDWIYDVGAVRIAAFGTRILNRAHTGNYALYLAWSIVGMGFVVFLLLRGR